MKIVLASKSPRRADILQQIGLKAEVVYPETDELTGLETAGGDPSAVTMENAKQKALAVLKIIKDDACIIGVDTTVHLDGKMLGKPSGKKQAKEYLTALSGRWHQVISSVFVISSKTRDFRQGSEITSVLFNDLENTEIDTYIKTGEPFDKAGAYGIQGKGAIFIRKIEGCYFNVVGLPVSLLYRNLKEIGVWVPSFWNGNE